MKNHTREMIRAVFLPLCCMCLVVADCGSRNIKETEMQVEAAETDLEENTELESYTDETTVRLNETTVRLDDTEVRLNDTENDTEDGTKIIKKNRSFEWYDEVMIISEKNYEFTNEATIAKNATFEETAVEPYTLYAQVSLNVRKYPDKDAEKLFALPVNAEVMVTAECENGWVEITYGEKNGYCNGVYLGENPVMMPEVMEVSGNVEETKSEYSCLIRGNCSDTEWNRFVAAWNAIPDGWKNEINNSGWQIICTNDDFWTARGYSILDGLTRYNEKYTYIRACGGRVDVVVPHEVGHIVDCYYGFPSLSEEFVGLFEAESSGFEEYKNETSQSKTNSTEYFAIIWLQILLAPSTESSAPNSFAFVRQYF